jgi:hypothetical protein
VSLQLQASPCGTTISLMSGYWEVGSGHLSRPSRVALELLAMT